MVSSAVPRSWGPVLGPDGGFDVLGGWNGGPEGDPPGGGIQRHSLPGIGNTFPSAAGIEGDAWPRAGAGVC